MQGEKGLDRGVRQHRHPPAGSDIDDETELLQLQVYAYSYGAVCVPLPASALPSLQAPAGSIDPDHM